MEKQQRLCNNFVLDMCNWYFVYSCFCFCLDYKNYAISGIIYMANVTSIFQFVTHSIWKKRILVHALDNLSHLCLTGKPWLFNDVLSYFLWLSISIYLIYRHQMMIHQKSGFGNADPKCIIPKHISQTH